MLRLLMSSSSIMNVCAYSIGSVKSFALGNSDVINLYVEHPETRKEQRTTVGKVNLDILFGKYE